jgi:hypothetical protein
MLSPNIWEYETHEKAGDHAPKESLGDTIDDGKFDDEKLNLLQNFKRVLRDKEAIRMKAGQGASKAKILSVDREDDRVILHIENPDVPLSRNRVAIKCRIPPDEIAADNYCSDTANPEENDRTMPENNEKCWTKEQKAEIVDTDPLRISVDIYARHKDLLKPGATILICDPMGGMLMLLLGKFLRRNCTSVEIKLKMAALTLVWVRVSSIPQ